MEVEEKEKIPPIFVQKIKEKDDAELKKIVCYHKNYDKLYVKCAMKELKKREQEEWVFYILLLVQSSLSDLYIKFEALLA
mgnify:CR=1 FL=1